MKILVISKILKKRRDIIYGDGVQVGRRVVWEVGDFTKLQTGVAVAVGKSGAYPVGVTKASVG